MTTNNKCFYKLLLCILSISLLVGCGSGGGGSSSSGEVASLEKSVSEQAQNVMPEEFVQSLNSALQEASGDPQYKEYLETFDGILKELQSALENPDNTIEIEEVQAIKAISYSSLKAKIDEVKNSFRDTLGDITTQGRKEFLLLGMGFGRGASVETGVAGSIGYAIAGELKAYGGGGVEVVYDFLHFESALFPFTVCGVDIGVGFGAGVGGLEVGFKGFENIIFGFKGSNGIAEYSGSSVGGQIGTDLDAKIFGGLGLDASGGYWRDTEDAYFLYGETCPYWGQTWGNLRGFNYSAGISFGTGAEFTALVKGGLVGTKALDPKAIVVYKDLPKIKNLPKKLRAKAAGVSLATTILFPKVVTVAKSPGILPMAAMAVIYGMVADVNEPSTVQNLSINRNALDQVSLSWAESTDDIGVAGYKIYRNGEYLKPVSATSAIDSEINSSSQYCYTVTAYDASGNESSQSSTQCIYPDSSPPSIPTSLSTTAVSSTQINLSWVASTDNVGVAGYNIYRDGAYLKSVSTNSANDVGLSASTQYCYTVSAYDAAGNESLQSNQVCATTLSTGYSISGRITSGGAGLAGVAVTLSGSGSASTTTDLNGNYSFAGVANGSYTLTSSKSGYTFSPSSWTVTVNNADVAGQDFNTTTGSGRTSNLPDTGQAKCYDNTQEITCPSPGQPFYGQDAQYSFNPMSFTDNGNGTVTDNVTDLMWQKEDDGVTRSWSGAVAYCDSLTLAGFSDWRLPTVDELIGIVDYGKIAPSIDTAVFPNTKASYYWSSTTYAGYASDAWYASFSDGRVYGSNLPSSPYARCVR